MLFRYRPRHGEPRPRQVTLAGSFTGWKPGPWSFQRHWSGEWRLELPDHLVRTPGNSGFPEFKFVVNGDHWVLARHRDRLPRMGENFVVLSHPQERPLLEERHRAAQLLKSSLTEFQSPEELANFRSVVGKALPAGRLFRSYHPFLASRLTPIEPARLETANRLWQTQGVRAIINLTDDSSAVLVEGTPRAYADLARNNRVLFAETSYEHAYYDPSGADFRSIVARVVTFVASTEGPWLVHCRLGCDRTGVVSALLGALAGLSWEEVAHDYELSNSLGIQEYRHAALLAFSLEQMTGTDPRDRQDGEATLSTRMEDFITTCGVPTEVSRQARRNLRGFNGDSGLY